MQILSINDWNREQEKCIPLRFRCDGRSYPDDGAEDEDDGGEDDYDDYDEYDDDDDDDDVIEDW